MASEPPAKKKCLGVDCDNDVGSLQCPTCLKLGFKDSYFCSQDCFKKNWASHKSAHKTRTTGYYNPFPSFPFSGPLRPVYPLSEHRTVPKSIPHPVWWQDGNPRYSRSPANRNKIEILDAKGQEAMRKSCRLAREVFDIAAAAAKPGVTTDYIDEVVHKACVERNVSVHNPSPGNEP